MFTTDLFEEVFASLAIGYHRTRNLQNTNTIGESGFKAGERSMYGPGIYLTYDFDDQQDDRMKSLYGPFVVRCKINLHGFLIFDQDVAARVYGTSRSSLTAQMTYLGLNEIATYSDKVTEFTSDLARDFAVRYFGKPAGKRPPLKGIVFTGRQDGRVIVAYDPSTVTAFSWARVVDLNKTRETVKWNKFAAPARAQPVSTTSPIEPLWRWFRAAGFGISSKGSQGATLVGIVSGIYLKLHLRNADGKVQVICYGTRQNPSKLPGWENNMGLVLYNETFPLAATPCSKILATIVEMTRTINHRKQANIAFATELLKRIVKPDVPISVDAQDGKDFRTDTVMLRAGPVTIKVDDPYNAFLTGKVFLKVTSSLDIHLGFNDGSRDTGKRDLATAYDTIFNLFRFFDYRLQKKLFGEELNTEEVLAPYLRPDFLAELMRQLRS